MTSIFVKRKSVNDFDMNMGSSLNKNFFDNKIVGSNMSK